MKCWIKGERKKEGRGGGGGEREKERDEMGAIS